jgi:iron(III) transport system substrate-binding protein
MKKTVSKRTAVLAIASALTALALPSTVLAQAAPLSGSITLYNAQHVTVAKAWAEAFEKETGVKVVIRNGGDIELANQLLQEGKNSPADVFLTENSPGMSLVESTGMLAPLAPATLAQVPANFRPASGNWTGIAARSTVFVYNKKLLTPEKLPKSMLDLTNPEWKGKWGAAPAGADFMAIVSALLELKGEAATQAWLKGMKENSKPYKGNSVVLKAVNTGEIPAGLIYHYYYYGDRAKSGENSFNVVPYYFRNEDPGAFVSISGGAVLASSKHPAEAQAFVKWITSKAGQEILKTGDSYEYAVSTGAESNAKLVPLNELQAPKVEPSKLDAAKVVDMMMKAGLL